MRKIYLINRLLASSEFDVGDHLPNSLIKLVEILFGIPGLGVRIHIGKQAEMLGANAFTNGFHIYFAPNKFCVYTFSGLQLLGHELAHVMQQSSGCVGDTSVSGMHIVSDSKLEDEADELGLIFANLAFAKIHFTDLYHQTIFRNKFKANILPLLVNSEARIVCGSRTIQLQTNIEFNNDIRPGSEIIMGLVHARNSHAVVQKDLAAYLSGYENHTDAVRNGCAICNHYISYSNVAEAVRQAIIARGNLQAVVNFLLGINAFLPGFQTFTNTDFGDRRPWSFNVGAIPPVNVASHMNGGVNFFSKSSLDREIDDLIANLANDPRNLFYWPDHTGDFGGTRVDEPRGAGNGFASIAHVKMRLASYHAHLRQLGFAV